MKKIAIFVDNLHVGGIQRSIANLMRNIDFTRYEVDLYLFDKEMFYELPKESNVIFLERPGRIYQFMPFRIVKNLLKVNVSDKEYDVAVDFDSYQMHTAVGALSVKAKKRAIWIHNDVPIKLKEEPKYRILHFFFKKKYSYFDSFCAVSKGALDSFKTIEDCEKKECLVIPNYIDTNEIKMKMQEDCDLKVSKKDLNIVTVGRLCHQKGLDIMFQQLFLLKEYREDFHLYIVGDGPDREKLEELRLKLGLEKHITFLGNQKNPFKYLKLMDLFYLSSRYEGQGMVILEAMSVGIDTLIPEHLEKYCPSAKGEKDTLAFLKNYKKKKIGKFNPLADYNEHITKMLDKLFKI